MRHVVSLVAAAAAAILAGACAPAVPDQPTWTEDVRPIVIANCIRCHSPPPLEGAPQGARFDKYDGEDRNGDGSVSDSCAGGDWCGAGTPLHDNNSIPQEMARRVALDIGETFHMPPDFQLFPRQQDVIAAWAEGGAPKGPALEGNSAPTIEVGDFQQEDGRLVADYQIDDADFDLATGKLTADPLAGGDPIVITYELFSGRSQIVWDVSGVASGSYQLTAEIGDDVSGDPVAHDVGTIDVP